MKILGFLLCAALTGWLAAQSAHSAERRNPPFQNLSTPPVAGFLRTSMGWRWHTCAGPGYPLQPNTVSTKLRPLWSTPGNGFGTYSLCPHGVLFMPSRLTPVGPSPGLPRLPPPPLPIPRGGGSNQVPVPPRPTRTNSVLVVISDEFYTGPVHLALPPYRGGPNSAVTPLTTPPQGEVQSILMEANRLKYGTNGTPVPPLPPTPLTPLSGSQGAILSLAGERAPLPESIARQRRAQR